MSNIKEYPFQALQFYATAPYKCSYLQNIEARSQVATPPQLIDTEVYAKLIKNGFRRSGLFTYRPYCDHCKACIATRIKVKDFAPSRSQTRAWKKHQHLEARVLPLSFSEEHFTLYQQYQQSFTAIFLVECDKVSCHLNGQVILSRKLKGGPWSKERILGSNIRFEIKLTVLWFWEVLELT